MITMPVARPRPLAGNQRPSDLTAFGKAPAAPAPKRKRTTSSMIRPFDSPVSMVNSDQMHTTAVSTLRAP